MGFKAFISITVSENSSTFVTNEGILQQLQNGGPLPNEEVDLSNPQTDKWANFIKKFQSLQKKMKCASNESSEN